jgi:hypothetical protein
MHNNCTKDCRELVVMGCAHSTVARWVTVFWGGKESGKQNRCWPDIQLQQLTMSAFHVRSHYCAEPSGEFRIGLSTSQKMSCRVWKYQNICSLANKMSVRDTLVQRLENARLLPSFYGRECEIFAGSLQIMSCRPILMNPTWRSDSDVNSVTSDHHICANINRNGVNWKLFSVNYDCKGFLLLLLSFLACQ